MPTDKCPACDNEFEPIDGDEFLCWVCQLYEEIEYAAENGYLNSGYYAQELYTGSDATWTYWGDSTPDEDLIPF